MTTVLVVDDEAAIRALFASVLEVEGYDVLTASDGAEALEHLQLSLVDVLLVDMMMPVLDGMGVLEALADDPHFDDLVKVVVSARDDPDEQAKARALGAHSWLVKPVSPERLLDTVCWGTSDISAFVVD